MLVVRRSPRKRCIVPDSFVTARILELKAVGMKQNDIAVEVGCSQKLVSTTIRGVSSYFRSQREAA